MEINLKLQEKDKDTLLDKNQDLERNLKKPSSFQLTLVIIEHTTYQRGHGIHIFKTLVKREPMELRSGLNSD